MALHQNTSALIVITLQDGKSQLVQAAELGNEMAVLKLLDDGTDVDFKHEVITDPLVDKLNIVLVTMM